MFRGALLGEGAPLTLLAYSQRESNPHLIHERDTTLPMVYGSILPDQEGVPHLIGVAAAPSQAQSFCPTPGTRMTPQSFRPSGRSDVSYSNMGVRAVFPHSEKIQPLADPDVVLVAEGPINGGRRTVLVRHRLQRLVRQASGHAVNDAGITIVLESALHTLPSGD